MNHTDFSCCLSSSVGHKTHQLEYTDSNSVTWITESDYVSDYDLVKEIMHADETWFDEIDGDLDEAMQKMADYIVSTAYKKRYYDPEQDMITEEFID